MVDFIDRLVLIALVALAFTSLGVCGGLALRAVILSISVLR